MDAVTATRCHLNVDPETTTIRNCTDCRTKSGAPLRAIVITQPGTFVLLSGQPTEYPKRGESGSVRLQGFAQRLRPATLAEFLLPCLRTIWLIRSTHARYASERRDIEPGPIP